MAKSFNHTRIPASMYLISLNGLKRYGEWETSSLDKRKRGSALSLIIHVDSLSVLDIDNASRGLSSFLLQAVV